MNGQPDCRLSFGYQLAELIKFPTINDVFR